MFQLEEKQKNYIYILATLILLAAHSLHPCIAYILNLVHIKLSVLMIVLYAIPMVLLAVIILSGEIKANRILLLFVIYIFYFVNYITATAKMQKHYDNPDVIALLVFYMPVAIILTTEVEDWKPLFNDGKMLAIIDFIMVFSLIAKKTGFDDTNYMSFSYGLLPLWGVLFISAFYYGNNIQWIFLVIGLYSGVFYGARGPLLWLIMLMIFTWCFCAFRDFQNPKYLLILFLSIGIAIVFIQVILPMFLNSAGAASSYILKRVNQGSMGESKGRDAIYDVAKRELSKLSVKPRGIFYDRTVLPENAYAHNIIYEIMLDYGWALGTILLLFLFIYILVPIYYQIGEGKLFYCFFTCTLFLRYFISGCMFDEGEFIVFMGVIISLYRQSSIGYEREVKENVTNDE